jgi:hypothetical protein
LIEGEHEREGRVKEKRESSGLRGYQERRRQKFNTKMEENMTIYVGFQIHWIAATTERRSSFSEQEKIQLQKSSSS